MADLKAFAEHLVNLSIWLDSLSKEDREKFFK